MTLEVNKNPSSNQTKILRLGSGKTLRHNVCEDKNVIATYNIMQEINSFKKIKTGYRFLESNIQVCII